jgi:hypothetical protein
MPLIESTGLTSSFDAPGSSAPKSGCAETLLRLRTSSSNEHDLYARQPVSCRARSRFSYAVDHSTISRLRARHAAEII